MNILFDYWYVLVILFIIFSGLVTVNQATIAVVTLFGKYQRILRPGLNFKIPVLEQIYKRISIQNRSVELEFQAVTQDQANVYFKSMLLYAVMNADEETIKKVAFKFLSDKDLMQALIRTIEGNIRSFVATKKQAEILLLRKEIVESVKGEVDHVLEDWGYHLLDLQINDITFDKLILESMSRVAMGIDGGAMAFDPAVASRIGFVPQGIGADLIATIEGFSRDTCDRYALQSQQRAHFAQANGYFDHAIIPVTDASGLTILAQDEFLRPNTQLEDLAKLTPAFAELGLAGYDSVAMLKYPNVEAVNHVHHAGNSSGIVDGAALLLIGTREKARNWVCSRARAYGR